MVGYGAADDGWTGDHAKLFGLGYLIASQASSQFEAGSHNLEALKRRNEHYGPFGDMGTRIDGAGWYTGMTLRRGT